MRKRFPSLASACAVAAIGMAGLVGSASAIVANTGTFAVNGQGSRIDGFNQANQLVNNVDGIGHMLVVPYFTVNGGNDTYLSIQNTDMRNGKAVKVRFRGAGNSDDIFDFTLFLSPGDVWTAAVSKHTSGLAMLRTSDTSCTLPSTVGKGTGTLFVTARLPGQAAAGTTEGYVEIFNMADVPSVRYTGTDLTPELALPTGTANALFTAIKHVNGVAPCTAATFTTLNPTTNPAFPFQAVAQSTANYTQSLNLGLLNPTTGLRASWVVINPAKASSWTGNAYAIEARDNNGQPGFGNIVFYPQTSDNVAIANARLGTADPLLRGGIVNMPAVTTTAAPGNAPVQAAMYDFPDMSTPYLLRHLNLAANGEGTRRQAFELTNALAVSSVSNEYYLETGLMAKTDWVFSLPTRRYNVARDYTGTGSNLYTNFTRDDAGNDLSAAMWNFFATENVTTNAAYPNILCVTGVTGSAGGAGTPTARLTSGQTGDREENFLAASSEFVVSPGVAGSPFSLCGEVAVLSFNDPAAIGTASAVLGGTLTRFNVSVPYMNGWARIATPGLATGVANNGLPSVTTNTGAAAAADTRAGLPVIGYAAMMLTNGAAAPGVSGNYGVTYSHSRTRYLPQ